MCQVHGCDPDTSHPVVRVVIPGHVEADVELCDDHAELYTASVAAGRPYLAGLIVPDEGWQAHQERHQAEQELIRQARQG